MHHKSSSVRNVREICNPECIRGYDNTYKDDKHKGEFNLQVQHVQLDKAYPPLQLTLKSFPPIPSKRQNIVTMF